jgi:aminoglycoside/choline kinase family phosphotransferase
MAEPIKKVETVFKKWSDKPIISLEPLPESGSYRTYYRIRFEQGCVLGVHNTDLRENEAFFYLNAQLKNTGNSVPDILFADPENHTYLEQDLGNVTLFDHLGEMQQRSATDNDILPVYRKVIDAMPGLQVNSTQGIDYSKCYPRAEFDVQSMMWDMNYFKYCLLKPLKINFFEQDLEDDFIKIVNWLIEADRNSFMFRDFQSRNIMLSGDNLYFIDFQGGRKGPLQYDLASLLFEAKTHLSENIRQSLLEYYLEVFSKTYTWFNPKKFTDFYFGFVYLRLMQAMGAYGFRGYIERKPLFLQSLPYAIDTLKWLSQKHPLPLQLKSLPSVFDQLKNLPLTKTYSTDQSIFTITVHSFSYKSGIPQDHSGNGGGFVFDCRCLENPGRYAEYKDLTGCDEPVIAFLENNTDVKQFMDHTFSLVMQSAEVYMKRGFSHLMIGFGCTGGQHRSVFFAEKLAKYLKDMVRANVVLVHDELEKKNLKA